MFHELLRKEYKQGVQCKFHKVESLQSEEFSHHSLVNPQKNYEGLS